MTEQEREEFLEAFQENSAKTLIGFCVMGGIFSEGIDLTGERLIGAAIVGTGLPQVGCEREILKNYYDEKAQNGFAYAYRYPGMNKVLQAAGRVIRTKEDRGVVLLLDERFLQREYLELFPQEWQGYERCTVGNAGQKNQGFLEQLNHKLVTVKILPKISLRQARIEALDYTQGQAGVSEGLPLILMDKNPFFCDFRT